MDSRSRLRFVTFLTAARFPLVLLFFAGAIVHVHAPFRQAWIFVATLTCLIAAAVTDLFDGYFARKFDVVTKLSAWSDVDRNH